MSTIRGVTPRTTWISATAAATALTLALALLAPVPAPHHGSPDPVRLAVGAGQIDAGGHRLGAGPRTGAEYALYGTTWPTTTLTYGFVNHTTDVPVAAQEAAVASALATWSSVMPLTFQQVDDCGLAFNAASCTTPDIRVAFGSGDHGSGATDPDFDGPGGTAAHAFYPPPNGVTAAGDLHFDDGERWSTTGSGVDIETIALHETGHSLGLSHATAAQCPGQSSSTRPTMCGYLIGVDRTLAPDDIAGIQALYGPPTSSPALCSGFAVTVDLADGARATEGRDVILGTPGADTIDALGGDDVVCGGGGADTIRGQAGADRLFGGTETDLLDGGAGNDLLKGGPQSDDCNGRGGTDTSAGCEIRRNLP